MTKAIITILVVFVISTVVICCAPPKLIPNTSIDYTPTKPPPGFTNYTSEGLFSISYPQEWIAPISFLSEYEDFLQESWQEKFPDIKIRDFQVLFFAGEEAREGYYPYVSVTVSPRTIGYWDLDEICEIEDQFARENSQSYTVYSQLRIEVNRQEVDITIGEYNVPESGMWKYTYLTTVNGDFIWFVRCFCKSDDFPRYDGMFDTIVRSICILN